MKFRKQAVALALTAGFVLGGQAQAVVVDDFDFTQSATIKDTSASNGGLSAGRGSGGTVLPGWTRSEIYADLFTGDGVEQTDCANCNEGHFVNDSNSVGNGYESWTGGPTDFSNTSWSLDYGVDVNGLDVVLSFVNNGVVTGEIWWKDIAATALPGTPGVLSGAVGAGVIADAIFIDEISVGGSYDPTGHGGANYGGVLGSRDFGAAAIDADFNKDNLRYETPEPSTLALLGLGLAGIGWQRRRKPNV